MHPATDRSACAAMDAEASARLASARLKTTSISLREDFHEACADRIAAAGRVAGNGAANGAEHQFRVGAESAQAAAQHVFRRSVGRRSQFQGSRLRAVTRQY